MWAGLKTCIHEWRWNPFLQSPPWRHVLKHSSRTSPFGFIHQASPPHPQFVSWKHKHPFNSSGSLIGSRVLKSEVRFHPGAEDGAHAAPHSHVTPAETHFNAGGSSAVAVAHLKFLQTSRGASLLSPPAALCFTPAHFFLEEVRFLSRGDKKTLKGEFLYFLCCLFQV